MVLLVSEGGVLEKVAYTLANPTVAGLVKAPREWPGILRHSGQQREIEMPDAFFDEEGSLPDSTKLELARPNIFAALTDTQLQARLCDAVAKLVKRARDDLALRGLPFVGARTVLRPSFSAAPKTPAPRRNPSPSIATKSTPARVHAIRRMQAFVREYRAACAEWRNGNRTAMFPAGPYALRVHARVACAPAMPA